MDAKGLVNDLNVRKPPAQRFLYSKISDQKRLVRGEHLLLARSILRVRDQVHHDKWRVLMLAGGSPSGEIVAIRELMPKAHIVTVDHDPICVELARHAGADESICCDLFNWSFRDNSPRKLPPEPLASMDKFDLIDLDMCGNVNEELRVLFSRYRICLLEHRGVLMITFSYGRDVVELFLDTLREWIRYPIVKTGYNDEYDRSVIPKSLLKMGVSPSLCGRLCYLFKPGQLTYLRSVMTYRGAEMPMCSLLFSESSSVELSYFSVEPGDFELAVVYPEAAYFVRLSQAAN